MHEALVIEETVKPKESLLFAIQGPSLSNWAGQKTSAGPGPLGRGYPTDRYPTDRRPGSSWAHPQLGHPPGTFFE